MLRWFRQRTRAEVQDDEIIALFSEAVRNIRVQHPDLDYFDRLEFLSNWLRYATTKARLGAAIGAKTDKKWPVP